MGIRRNFITPGSCEELDEEAKEGTMNIED